MVKINKEEHVSNFKVGLPCRVKDSGIMYEVKAVYDGYVEVQGYHTTTGRRLYFKENEIEVVV